MWEEEQAGRALQWSRQVRLALRLGGALVVEASGWIREAGRTGLGHRSGMAGGDMGVVRNGGEGLAPRFLAHPPAVGGDGAISWVRELPGGPGLGKIMSPGLDGQLSQREAGCARVGGPGAANAMGGRCHPGREHRGTGGALALAEEGEGLWPEGEGTQEDVAGWGWGARQGRTSACKEGEASRRQDASRREIAVTTPNCPAVRKCEIPGEFRGGGSQGSGGGGWGQRGSED